jgi:hypothetical protein
MGFSGPIPGHGSAPANPAASDNSTHIFSVTGCDVCKPLIAFEQLLHNDEGCTGLGSAVQEVVLAALRHPTSAAQTEKTEGVGDLEGHRRGFTALMMAVCWLGATATFRCGDEVIEAELKGGFAAAVGHRFKLVRCVVELVEKQD